MSRSPERRGVLTAGQEPSVAYKAADGALSLPASPMAEETPHPSLPKPATVLEELSPFTSKEGSQNGFSHNSRKRVAQMQVLARVGREERERLCASRW